MSYLVDTHIIIWFVENDSKLSDSVRQILEDTSNVILVSHASFWEMAIKKSIGKLQVTLTQPALERELAKHLIHVLDFKTAHYEKLLSLPFFHQDPFDRMLISQAITDDITIITQDNKFRLYEEFVSIIWNK